MKYLELHGYTAVPIRVEITDLMLQYGDLENPDPILYVSGAQRVDEQTATEIRNNYGKH